MSFLLILVPAFFASPVRREGDLRSHLRRGQREVQEPGSAGPGDGKASPGWSARSMGDRRGDPQQRDAAGRQEAGRPGPRGTWGMDGSGSGLDRRGA